MYLLIGFFVSQYLKIFPFIRTHDVKSNKTNNSERRSEVFSSTANYSNPMFDFVALKIYISVSKIFMFILSGSYDLTQNVK